MRTIETFIAKEKNTEKKKDIFQESSKITNITILPWIKAYSFMENTNKMRIVC